MRGKDSCFTGVANPPEITSNSAKFYAFAWIGYSGSVQGHDDIRHRGDASV